LVWTSPPRPRRPAPVRSRDRDFDLKGLERILKYQFKDAGLARTAMTHRSYLHASPGGAANRTSGWNSSAIRS
jgi:hypothetical protein